MVISETAITLNHYLDNNADIQRVGVTSAETEMKVGESKRRIPFLTNSSAFRNKIMEKFIYNFF
jgi:hypothetical protein